jgi:hypothetical protein
MARRERNMIGGVATTPKIAHPSPRLVRRPEHVCRGGSMKAETADEFIKDLLKAQRARLGTTASVAKAAHACAEAGSPERAIDIVIELGDDLHEAKRLFEATLAVARCSKG